MEQNKDASEKQTRKKRINKSKTIKKIKDKDQEAWDQDNETEAEGLFSGKVWTSVKKFFWVLPFIIGLIGYYWGNIGERGVELDFWEAVYASAALYFVNPVAENSNIFIIVAKIMALIVVAHLILSVVTSLVDRFRKWIIRRYGSSTAVYTDTPLGRTIEETAKHGYLGTDTPDGKAETTHDHIIMFDNDISNLSFYEANKSIFDKRNRKVFIALKQVDPLLLKSVDNKNVHFFNVYEIESRKFWEKHNLYDEINDRDRKDKVFRIAIIGYGLMGKAIFKQGFLNNIYRIDQIIEYHIWGARPLDRKDLEELNTANSDKIIIHDMECRDEISDILEMNRVIVTLTDPLPVVQELISRPGICRIYCYNEEGEDFSEFYNTNRLFVFGNFMMSMTVDDIKTEKLYENAKLINYDYELRSAYSKEIDNIKKASGDTAVNDKAADDLKAKYEYNDGRQQDADEKWDKLNGFTKGSNVARADYYWIEYINKQKGVSPYDRAKMEHIRWCRYHYYNGWSYAEGPKDPVKKTHSALVEFEKLSDETQDKDYFFSEQIRKKLDDEAERIYKESAAIVN
ncbi:MAG: hypothetical protein J5824_09550 [Lachnospiraceae bacterium]|nr:hypothetical protein [Lachnospiraceae bacterium]